MCFSGRSALLQSRIRNERRTSQRGFDRRHEANVRIIRLEPAEPDAATAIALREQLQRGVERLSLEHRAVIVLRLCLGLSIEETAAAIGI